MQLARIGLPPSEICDSEGISKNLATKSVRGGLTTVASQLSSFCISLAGTVVLARLLTPKDYGLVGMVTVVITFAAMFKTFGLSAATIQRSAITRDQISALFWINLGVGVVLAACVLAASPLVGRFYHQSLLVPVAMVLASTLVVDAVIVQHDAILRRHVRFGGLALAGIVSDLLGLAVSVVLAVMGFRYWALVWGTVASAAAVTVGTFLLCPWTPGRFKRGTGIRDMLGFGANATGFEFVNYFARNLDNILIGRYVGAVALGYYAKAYNLFMLPLTQIRGPVSQAAMPVLSSLKNDPERYAKYYNRITDILATLVMPVTVLIVVEADFLVRIILGSQWQGVVPLFRILAIAGLIQGVTTTRGLVLLTMGYAKRYLRFGTARAVLVSAAFIAGLWHGASGVAAAYAAVEWVILVPSLCYCFNRTPVSVGDFLKALVLPGVLSLVAGGLALLARYLIGYGTSVASVIAVVVFLVVYVGASSFRPLVRDTVRRSWEAITLPHSKRGADA